MLWAIVNRHYRRMTIKAVAFPVVHIARASRVPTLDIEKVEAEIVGAALYAALTAFLIDRPDHELDFSPADAAALGERAARHRDQRVDALLQSFSRVVELREELRRLARPGEFDELLAVLDEWFTRETFERVRTGVCSVGAGEVGAFLASLRAIADDYALAPAVDIGGLRAQVRSGVAT